MPTLASTSRFLDGRWLAMSLVLFLVLALMTAGPSLAQKPDDPGMVKFRGAAFPVDEEAGDVVILVKRLRGSTGEVSVAIEFSEGTAIEGEDWLSPDEPIILEWDDGDRSDKTFTVEILDDDLDEGQETFGVTFVDATGGLEISPPSTAVVRIKPSDRSDDDGEDDGEDEGEDEGEEETELGVIEFTAARYPAFESSGMAEVVVERDDGSDGEVSVEVEILEGSAEEGVDYPIPTPVTLTWADGEDDEKSFMVELIDDTEPEDLETMTVVLQNATGGASIGPMGSASIVIIDDDGGEGDCVPDESTLCLLDGRFQVTGSWRDYEDNEGDVQWIPSSDESGLGWFFSDSNVELLLKMLDGCGVNDHFWVFLAATTDVEYEVEITDLTTDEVKSYSNELGEPADADIDTAAFACDP